MDCCRGIIADCVPPNPLEGETPHTRLPALALEPFGPTPLRRFTDCTCCFIFLVLLSLCLSYPLFYFDSSSSNLNHMQPHDSDRNPCLFPYKYIYLPTSDIQRSVCIEECPAHTGVPLKCLPNSIFRYCPSSTSGLVKNQQLMACHRMDIQLPTLTTYQKIINSVYRSKYSYIFPAVFATILSAFIVGTIFALPGVMTYLYMLLFEVVLILATILCYYRYFKGHAAVVDRYIPTLFVQPKMLLVFGIFFTVVVVVSICFILYWFRRSQMIFLVAVIRIARYCYCQSLLLGISLFLSLICLGTFLGYSWLFNRILSVGYFNPNSSEPWSQFLYTSFGRFIQCTCLFLALWNHGLMISLSHFVFSSIGTLWYYSPNKSMRFFDIVAQTIKYVTYHFGTIIYGSIYEFYSQTLVNYVNSNQFMLPPVKYQYCCCIHNCCFRYLFKYSSIQTILHSHPFWESNINFYQLRKRTSIFIPQLYLFGNFYSNTIRAFVTVVTVFMSYFMFTFLQPGYYHNLSNPIPAMVITGMLAYQIATCWVASAGYLGDVIVFNYCVQNLVRMEKYGMLDAPHCPIGIMNIITNSKPILI